MIQDKNQKQSTVIQEGQSQGSIGMSLDSESAQMLMQMLSKNLYSDAIGSAIRECASNALDSHRRAGVTDPIIVSLKINNENNYEFSVEDFGTGLDADDVENIISKYGKSTKRESNIELGMMGLGFKAPLAYTSSFYFVCRKNGKERKYMMYEGEELNTIDLLYETDTPERNGVKIIIPVKYNDRLTFLQKIKNQLAYFESVFFDANVNGSPIDNNFHILRTEHFQSSEINTDTYMHICLDNVYYPMDFGKLGISHINVPIGLRFGLSDGLFPTPNREQLIYSPTAIKTILDKIALVGDALINKYNENSIDCKDIHTIFTYYNSKNRYVNFANIKIDADLFSKFSKIQFKKPEYSNYQATNFEKLYLNRDYLLHEYGKKYNFSRGQFRHITTSWDLDVQYRDISNSNNVFIFDEPFVGNKKSYIKTLLPQNTYDNVYFIKKIRKMTLYPISKVHSYNNYVTLLDLRKYPKSTWRKRIVECQQIVEELIKDFRIVDDIQISQLWLDSRKKQRVKASGGGGRRVKLQGEINCKKAEELQRYVHGKSSKLTPEVLKVGDISSSPYLLVYGRQKDEATIDGLYAVSLRQKVKYFVLSEREYKIAETIEIHNLMSIEKFMEGKSKTFKRIVTGYLIKELIKKYESTFAKKSIISKISVSLHDKLTALHTYKDQNYVAYCEHEIYVAMVKVAEEHNLFDECIYTEYRQIKNLLDNYPFIETTMKMIPSCAIDEGYEHYITVFCELFKYHKQRIDFTNYNHLVPLNEDKPLEDELTDETIGQLNS